MKNNLIRVVLPYSFVEEQHLSLVDISDGFSVVFNNKPVSFQVDLLPDDYFDNIHLTP